MKTLTNILLFVCVALCGSCNHTGNSSGNKAALQNPATDTTLTGSPTFPGISKDSLELVKLVIDMYKWHDANRDSITEIIPIKLNAKDTFYKGLDLAKTNEAVNKLQASGFFSKLFLDTFRQIAVIIDKKLKNGACLWADGDMPDIPGFDVDRWCNCQDYPVDPWDWGKISLKQIHINGETASFIWDGGGFGQDKFTYQMGAQKEGGKWKVSSMEGFRLSDYVSNKRGAGSL